MMAGRRRWVERMRLAKARGLIAKFPGGRKPGVHGKVRSADKVVAQAQRVLEAAMTRRAVSTSADGKPWERLSKREKLSAATDMALDITRQILELGVDPRDVRLLAHVKDVALTVISQQLRVDEQALDADRHEAERERALSALIESMPPALRERAEAFGREREAAAEDADLSPTPAEAAAERRRPPG